MIRFRVLVVAVAVVAAPPAARADEPATRSTYNCISIYWTRPAAASCEMRFQREGEVNWNAAQNLYWDGVSGVGASDRHPAQQGQFRGSIVNLKPGTRHRVRLLVAGEPAKEISVWTCAYNPATSGPAVKSIPTGSNVAFTTSGGGNASSWQIYDGNDGTISNTEGGPNVALAIRHNKVIVRNLKISGARKNAILIKPGVSDVIIENCDIWNWGRSQAKANDENGNAKDWDYGTPVAGDVAIGAQDGAIVADKTRRVTVRNCRIHHPRYRAALWHEFAARGGHPHGPFAIRTGATDGDAGAGAWEGSHVVCANEFYSDSEQAVRGYFRVWARTSPRPVCPAPIPISGATSFATAPTTPSKPMAATATCASGATTSTPIIVAFRTRV